MNRDDAIRAIMTSLDAGSMRDYDNPKIREMYSHIFDSLKAKADAALTGLEAMGIALVPVEATDEMLWGDESAKHVARGVWRSMVARSPMAPSGGRSDD